MAKTKAMTEDTQPHNDSDGTTSYVPLEIEYAKMTPSQYANQLMVQADQQCIYLHFYQTRPPIILKSDSPTPTSVEAQAVTSVAIPLEAVPRFVQIMQAQYDFITGGPNANTSH